MKKLKTLKLSPWLTLLAYLLLSGFALAIVFWIQKGPILETIRYCLKTPYLMVFNYLPIAILMGLLFFLCRNVFYSAGITTLFWGLLSYINLIKVEARGDPFVPGDILLLSEGIEAVGSYELQLHWGLLSVLLLYCIVLGIIGIFIKSHKPVLLTRILGAFLLIGSFITSMLWLYSDDALYQRAEGPTRSNVPAVFDAFDFPYCFLHNFNLFPVDRPEDYSKAAAETYEETYLAEKTTPDSPPNIIMIMCEAFTDLPNAAAFRYSPEDNPIAYYNALAAQEDTIAGHLIVSNIGAGTANTEFDVLTGMMTNRLSPATSSAFRVVHRNTDSVPRMLESAGYKTFFMHPGSSWFYNRQSVYSYLGITDQVFSEAFTKEDFKGSWISDEAFLQVLIECMEERQSTSPQFTYAVTIQNHQSYGFQKYGFLPEAVQTDITLSENAATSLAVYFEGLRDSDQMLEDLVAYLEEQEEPYLLVFFGDHQPTLGADYLAYRELGVYPKNMELAEERLSMYTVPFVIWGNATYRQDHDLAQISEHLQLGDAPLLSSHYLGALTCQIAGYNGWDGYFDYLNQLRLQLPVCSVYGYRTADGTWLEALPEDLNSAEELRWHWQYYRLKDQPVTN